MAQTQPAAGLPEEWHCSAAATTRAIMASLRDLIPASCYSLKSFASNPAQPEPTAAAAPPTSRTGFMISAPAEKQKIQMHSPVSTLPPLQQFQKLRSHMHARSRQFWPSLLMLALRVSQFLLKQELK